MADAASGSQAQWYYGIEDSSGVIQPNETTPAWYPIRFNTSDIARDTNQVESNEINDERQRNKARQGTYAVAGSIVAELTFGGAIDYLMAAALQSSWTSQVSDTQSTFAATASDNSINDSGSGFIVAGFQVGDRVTITGFTESGNNITDGKITSLTAGKMIIASTIGDTIVDEVEGDSVTITTAGDYVDVASTPPRIALLRRSTDVSVDVLYRSCRVSDLGLAVILNQSAALTFNVVGESVENYSYPVGSTTSTATTTEMMVPTIGSMKDADTAQTILTDYNLQLTNGMEPLFSLFQRDAYAVQNGIFQASGSMSAYMPDSTLLDKFLDETETDHIVKLQDLAGNWFRFILPDVLYTQLGDPISGPGAQILNYSFSAGYETPGTVRIERKA